MARFECKKCGSLVVVEEGVETVTCNVCGKNQNVPAILIDDQPRSTRNDYDPQWDHYAKLLHKARTYRDIQVLTETAEEFDRLGDYENSREMAEFCRKRIVEEQIKRNAEVKMRDVNKQRNNKGQKRYHIKMTIINACVVAIAVAIIWVSNLLVKEPGYDEGLSLMAAGMYDEAIYKFRRLGNYKDSEELLDECRNAIFDQQYNEAVELMNEEHYLLAQQKFDDLNGYKDSETMILECRYRNALLYMEKKNYRIAMEEFYRLGDYKDAAKLFEEVKAKLTGSQ